MRIPVVTSEWTRIAEFPDNHVGDFSIFRDALGTWHCLGTMGTGRRKTELTFFHCKSRRLLGPYEPQPTLLPWAPRFGPDSGENLSPQKRAPFVLRKDGIYHMFYTRPPGTLMHVTARDAAGWNDLGRVVFEKNDARDVCIRKSGDGYLMYYCQHARADGENRSCIMLRRSENLNHWSDPQIVYFDVQRAANHSYLESPCMVQRPDGYYLFMRHRLMDERTTTVVLYSPEPDHFELGLQPWVQELHNVHAPEIISAKDACCIVRVSGGRHDNPNAPDRGGWLEAAKMEFL